jgi:sulfide:quinone oxidoreductase
MNKVTFITPNFAVTGALSPQDFPEIRAMGFTAVVSNLPDGESAAYPTAIEEAKLAEAAGLAFRHIPTTKFDLFTDRVVGGMQTALGELAGPVLAHCASGMRSAAAWAGAASRLQPADCVLDALQRAGFNLSALREELQEQGGASASHAGPIPAPLDAACGTAGRAGSQ